ncbi:hypothetical protein OHB30_17725 [Streptomyces europaeiscabiei]|nr:hypothetical protein OHB30_17725 [Streptomyces europaeiscabiei]
MADSQDLRVSFHPLQFRKDRDEWLAGRQGNDRIVAVPKVGMAAMRLLAAGSTVEETRSRLRADIGRDLDVRAFVEQLADAGLVASVGDRHFPFTPAPVSLPWIEPRHVRWVMSPVLHVVVLAIPLAGLLTLALSPRAMPSWSDLLWSDYGTFTLVVQCLVAWFLIGLHELAHLGTARAAGVPGRVRLGTRLQFLVAQTEVSGIWLKSRRERLTVYLSGPALDGAIWGGCILAVALGVHHLLLPVVAMTLLASLANQCLVFMRTDLYFVVQDLTGCRNLYGDAGRYLRHVGARLAARPSQNPLRSLHDTERRVLQVYALATAAGTLVCVFFGLRFLLDVSWPLLNRSVMHLYSGADPLVRLDALATVLLITGLQALWVHLWWRRHADGVWAASRAVRRHLQSRS